ncbi:phage shock protein operon transcriptional activator [Oceanispirochaeta crateris]|uniref:Phage shock protein operon transcriptional activator n=1 Tax=Oceanispirochaeta crateris TaxID=2518645 RepID=A0A5C1QM55_9SPIO|nr:phage shock protein operon transcriptional activator [Oceanispirochaeta crateris]QEN08408.1 phage shock protein operon transcriptional activator [Oceanispirochaeta crateris]
MNRDYNPSADALGESSEFMDFQQNLSMAARVDRPVLLVGERGTGKELAATRLHFLSGRWKDPYIPVNCAALPPSLLESELFGHESGAFTGAGKMRKGRFEEAHKGTLFLDEIGLVPMEVQEKILRTVEYGRFSRVGSSTEMEVDVRIIAATNADLPTLCKEGKFKEDLLDRLSFEVLYLPPLRYRSTDIDLLAGHFAMRMAREMGKPEIPEFSPELIQKMREYSWPGNIRELKNTVERAVYKTEGSLIEELNLNPFNNPYLPDMNPELKQESEDSCKDPRLLAEKEIPLNQFREYILELELHFIRRALEENRYSQKKAAEALGLTYDQFRGLYKKYQSSLEKENG